MKELLIMFTFLLVFTVSLTPAVNAAESYPPKPADIEDGTESGNPVNEIKEKTKDESYYSTGGYNLRSPYENYNGGLDGTAEGESIKMWFCGNNPFGSTSQGAGAYNYVFDGRNTFNATAPGLIDQNELRNAVIQKCMKSEKYTDWHTTDTVYVVIYAPGYNVDKYKTDYIGNTQHNEIFCTSDSSPTVGMYRDPGGREGASWGYQSWIADRGFAYHLSLYLPAKIGGPTSYLGNSHLGDDFMADQSFWESPGDSPGYMQWWSNLGNAGLAATKGVKEIGHDTGVFAGTVTLSGVKRFMALPEKYSYGVLNTDYNKQFTTGSERSNTDLIGSKICSMQTDRTGGFTIAWEYSEDKFVSKTAYYTMREGEVKFGDDIVTMDQQVSVVLSDRDVSIRPWDATPVEVKVWSDSDKGGIKLELRHERDWWVMQADDQTFYGTLFLTSDQESRSMETSGKGGIRCYQGECYERGSGQLHAQPGDHIYVQYKDYTLPKPYGLDGCAMSSSDFTIDDEPNTCEHVKIYNFAKVTEATPLSKIALRSVSILPYEKPDVNELNEINADISQVERDISLEKARVAQMGHTTSEENMSKYSFKYDGRIEKLNELKDDAQVLKDEIKYHIENKSHTFITNEPIHITGTFYSSTYSSNDFIFAAEATHLESGQTEFVKLSPKTSITKKNSVDVDLTWTPMFSGEYILKLFAMDGTTYSAILKNPVVNHIEVVDNTQLASGPETIIK